MLVQFCMSRKTGSPHLQSGRARLMQSVAYIIRMDVISANSACVIGEEASH
uniref:Uncharacterized protein n=1 Tax=Anguilla anguilla TaxID=7936 RepID=A0A0E9VRC4_ANGAN